MFFSIPHPHYFSYKPNREVKQIYWFTMLNGFGLSLAYIFEPIYLYHLGFNLVSLMWFYVQVYCWYCVLMMLGAKFAHRFGLKHSILLGNCFYLLYWIGLFLIGNHPWLFIATPILFAIQKSFLWPAFNTLTSLASNRSERGRQVGMIMVLVDLAYIVGPFLGGIISQSFGFYYLFLAAGTMMILSSIPLFFTSEVKFSGSFRVRQLLYFVTQNPRNFFGYFGYAEDLMLMSLWPVLMYIILGQLFGVGLITTFASLVACVLMLYIGRLADHTDKSKLTGEVSFFYALTWFFRFTAINAVSVLIFDTMTKIGKGLINIPLVSLTFETARQRDKAFTLVYSTFVEFSLSMGKIVTALASIIILKLTHNIYLVFVFAGVLTLFYALLTTKIKANGFKKV
ncbi:MAG: MFS transporter [Candidatus Doudnabacteria bacterium]|nr:MFS transporter [Candidatus Doudnabacteria bacterium]